MALRSKLKQFFQTQSLAPGPSQQPSDRSKPAEQSSNRAAIQIIREAWGLTNTHQHDDWYARQLRALGASRLIWLLPDPNNKEATRPIYRVPYPLLLTLLGDRTQGWRLVCPLLELVPATTSSSQEGPNAPQILQYLQQAALGEEMEGVLFLPDFLRSQLKRWNRAPQGNSSLLGWFAQLKAPFRQLVSPHPLFDCEHYSSQRRATNPTAASNELHPVVDYLMGCTRSHRIRALEPSAKFSPCLWPSHLSTPAGSPTPSPHLIQQAPLALFLFTMRTASNSCPIGSHKLAGVLEGLDDEGLLKGWCEPVKPGSPTELQVWLTGVKVGTGTADQPRTDVARRGVQMRDCGFAIPIDWEALPLNLLAELATARWQVVTNDQEATLGRGDWPLTAQDREQVAAAITKGCLQAGDLDALKTGLEEATDRSVLEGSRQQVFTWCALQAAAGVWDPTALLVLQKAALANSVLQQGVEADSCTRAELLLLALHQLYRHWSGGNPPTPGDVQLGQSCAALADQLAERCYFGPTTRERQCWDAHLRPLFNVVIATLLLQEKPTDLDSTPPLLLASLVRLSQEVYGDLLLARTLTALFTPERGPGDSAALRLQLRSGDALGVAIALFHQRGMGLEPTLSTFDQALALLEISKQSLSTIEAALARLLPLIPAQQARTLRSSFCRRLLDQLGWHVNTLSAGLIDQLIANNAPQALGLAVRERTISLLTHISQALWAGDDGRSGCTPLPRSTKPPLRWLLIGERSLPQCWLYRVEQKRQQLERCGAEVRCIEKGDLDTWSFSQQVAWADAVLFCRTPATYGVIRALTFARHCGKRVFADIDDLVFSSAFPAPYITYGGSISRSIHRRLGLDAPLQRWPLEQADAVITSTAALADACRGASAALADKPITVLPNLPLPELLGLARRLAHQPPQRAPRLVVSSGTLAHRHIWSDQLAPAIAQLLGNHPQLRLSLIGHLELPACLQPFSGRISTVPYSYYSHYLQHLAEGSIALVPLEDHPTTHCKSAIKWMEASLLGLATVCSPVRAYTDAATAEQHVLLTEDQQAWVQQVERLLADPELLARLSSQARQHAQASFHEQLGEQIWNTQFLAASGDSSSTDHNPQPASPHRQKLLVINVFFAPQSFGGATRVAQDQVRDILKDHGDAYDVTVLCIDHDPWQDLTSDALPLDLWHWHGARILRLAVPPRPWADIEDTRVESFCRQWFQDESFDLIHCHCTQVLTASPLVVAKQLGIPYLVTLHDAWWLSPELFLVSPAGRQIDPAKPFDHIDGTPTPEEKAIALERRSILAGILRGAQQRLAVSDPFRKVYERAGVEEIDVRENKFTPMPPPLPRPPRSPGDPLRICHVGGMAMHKGYHILRQAVHLLPAGLNLELTVIDHRLQEDEIPYTSNWNGYHVQFIAPVPMNEMGNFYASQDILIAPSLWPESYGLVTREAASAGLTVIAADSGNLSNFNISRGRKITVESNNATALAESITLAIKYHRRSPACTS